MSAQPSESVNVLEVKKELNQKYGRLDPSMKLRGGVKLPSIAGSHIVERSRSIDPNAKIARNTDISAQSVKSKPHGSRKLTVIKAGQLYKANMSYEELRELNKQIQDQAVTKKKMLALEGRPESESQFYNENYSFNDEKDETVLAKADDLDDIPEPTIRSVSMQPQPIPKRTPAKKDFDNTESELNKIQEQIKQVDTVLDKSDYLIKKMDSNLMVDLKIGGYGDNYSYRKKHSRSQSKGGNSNLNQTAESKEF